MRIRLLVDYRGVLTEEEYYTAGEYIIPGDMPDAFAENLISAGRAVVVEPKPAPRVSRKTKRPAKKQE